MFEIFQKVQLLLIPIIFQPYNRISLTALGSCSRQSPGTLARQYKCPPTRDSRGPPVHSHVTVTPWWSASVTSVSQL